MCAGGRAERLVSMSLLWMLSSSAAALGDPPAAAPSPAVVAAPAEAPVEDRRTVWQKEIKAITDLLIDGSYAPAKERASRLLEEEELPGDMVLRAQKLFAKAAAKLRSAETEPVTAEPEPVPQEEAPPEPQEEAPPRPRQTLEIRGSNGAVSGKERAAKESNPTAFRVRLAQTGSGFASGVNGVLRIAGDRLEFTPGIKGGKGWAIHWSDLAAARPDDGIWDCAFPVAIIDRAGHNYFVARIDDRGVYLAGDSMLAAIAQARKKRPAGPAAGEAPAKDGG